MSSDGSSRFLLAGQALQLKQQQQGTNNSHIERKLLHRYWPFTGQSLLKKWMWILVRQEVHILSKGNELCIYIHLCPVLRAWLILTIGLLPAGQEPLCKEIGLGSSQGYVQNREQLNCRCWMRLMHLLIHHCYLGPLLFLIYQCHQTCVESIISIWWAPLIPI